MSSNLPVFRFKVRGFMAVGSLQVFLHFFFLFTGLVCGQGFALAGDVFVRVWICFGFSSFKVKGDY